MRLLHSIAAVLLIIAATAAQAEPAAFDRALLDIQHRWAEVNYELDGGDQKHAFEALLDDARALQAQFPGRAEAAAWRGIVASSYAGVKGPFGAMSLAKEAREALTTAESIDADVLDGSVYTSLGVLYARVPGGFIGFGDKDLAREYLKKALAVNPDGIDPNYFYGEFLYEENDYTGAKLALEKARAAAPRPDRPLADRGRQAEITDLLARIDRKLTRGS